MITEAPSIIDLERFLNAGEVAYYYGLKSRVSVWRWRKEGRIPKPDLERGNMKRWKVRSLIEWDKIQSERDRSNVEPSTGKNLLRRLGLS